MFSQIKSKVQARFAELSTHDLFVVGLSHNELFDAYLAALPEEDRQEHNCNCCKSFLNHYGSLVAIVDGAIKTLWEFEVEAPYNNVPAALDAIIRSKPITDAFVSKEIKLGTDSNVSLSTGIRWTHFYCELPASKRHRSFATIDTVRGNIRTQQQTFKRALESLTEDSVDTVLELIAQNSLYRGTEFKNLLADFRRHQVAVKGKDLDSYCWTEKGPVTGIRNSVIGSLLVDLSEGRDLESAVRSYEQKVAPTNYRRPTALVTKGMLEKAEKDLADLGMLSSLNRCHATIDDIPVSEVLFVDRSAKVANGGLFDQLKSDAPVDPKSFSKVETVSYERFVNDVLPTATSVEILVENKHASRFVNLTKASDSDAPVLFSWGNDIAWAYKDGNADSIKERVKEAGGSVTGDLRISLAWYNYDDLDLHVREPSRYHIYFSSKKSPSTGGELDVDMNAGSGRTRNAVENITYPDESRMRDGTYTVQVNNYCKREGIDVGFEVEIEYKGAITTLSFDAPVGDGATIDVAKIQYSRTGGVVITSALPNSQKGAPSKVVHGIATQKFHPVTMIAPSPNFWGGKTAGNRHTFFFLDEAYSETPVRGFFNEFLKSELSQHRKVFELLGAKTMIPAAGPQLAGLGFSSTQHDELICRVGGNFNRVIKVQF